MASAQAPSSASLRKEHLKARKEHLLAWRRAPLPPIAAHACFMLAREEEAEGVGVAQEGGGGVWRGESARDLCRARSEAGSEVAKIPCLLDGSFGGFSKILANQILSEKLMEML